MSPVQGRDTDGFGRWLTGYLAASPTLSRYRVYYDHGDSTLDNVAAIKGFYGDSVTNLNRLADVDVMVVSPLGEVVLLVEIEERGSSPKKVFGDAVTILMCNHFAVGRGRAQECFAASADTRLIISGVMPDRGTRIAKIEQVAAPRFREFTGLAGGILPGNVDFAFAPDIVATVSRLKDMTARLLHG
jgi:hypothetical protein